MGQAVSLVVPGNLVHLCLELLRIFRHHGPSAYSAQQLLHPGKFKGRPKETRKKPAFLNQAAYLIILHIPGFQITLQKRLITHGSVFPEFFCPCTGKISTSVVQTFLKFPHSLLPVRTRLVHFIDKEEYRYPVFCQQAPQGYGMALYSVRTAYNQNRIIQHLERSLHFSGKIHMARRI